jgi:N-acetylneuraminate synthase/sialic acid synthase
MSVAAYALGARIIEKHFTLNRTLKGTDHAFSLEPQGLSKLVRDLDRLHVALGDGIKRQYESEFDPLQKMGKKIVASKAISKGTVLASEDFEFKSPGDGLAPWRIEEIIGKTLTRNLEFEEAISENDYR